MTTLIEIEGGLARVIERSVSYEANLADLMPHLETRLPVTLPTLPRNRVVAAHYDESSPPVQHLQLIVELPPAIRTLPLPHAQLRPQTPPRVAVPYTLFHFYLSNNPTQPPTARWAMTDVRCYFSENQTLTPDQLIIPATLPNVYDDGRICFGNTAVRADQPLIDRIDEVVNTFYLSEFGPDHVRTHLWPWKKSSYLKWAQETTTHGPAAYHTIPEFTAEADWHTRFALADVLHQGISRTTPIVLGDPIPDLVFHPTFGRAEQWLRELTPLQRNRLHTALANLVADDPTTLALPPIEQDEDEID